MPHFPRILCLDLLEIHWLPMTFHQIPCKCRMQNEKFTPDNPKSPRWNLLVSKCSCSISSMATQKLLNVKGDIHCPSPGIAATKHLRQIIAHHQTSMLPSPAHVPAHLRPGSSGVSASKLQTSNTKRHATSKRRSCYEIPSGVFCLTLIKDSTWSAAPGRRNRRVLTLEPLNHQNI